MNEKRIRLCFSKRLWPRLALGLSLFLSNSLVRAQESGLASVTEKELLSAAEKWRTAMVEQNYPERPGNELERMFGGGFEADARQSMKLMREIVAAKGAQIAGHEPSFAASDWGPDEVLLKVVDDALVVARPRFRTDVVSIVTSLAAGELVAYVEQRGGPVWIDPPFHPLKTDAGLWAHVRTKDGKTGWVFAEPASESRLVGVHRRPVPVKQPEGSWGALLIAGGVVVAILFCIALVLSKSKAAPIEGSYSSSSYVGSASYDSGDSSDDYSSSDDEDYGTDGDSDEDEDDNDADVLYSRAWKVREYREGYLRGVEVRREYPDASSLFLHPDFLFGVGCSSIYLTGFEDALECRDMQSVDDL